MTLLAAALVVAAFLAGLWWGRRQSEQYLVAAHAVQTITNETVSRFREFIEADSRTALTIAELTTKIAALDQRQATLGRGIDAMARELSTLVARDSPLGAPLGRRPITDHDLT
jgi:hypothetical protein